MGGRAFPNFIEFEFYSDFEVIFKLSSMKIPAKTSSWNHQFWFMFQDRQRYGLKIYLGSKTVMVYPVDTRLCTIGTGT